jgi:hypothetical protein
MNQEEKTLRNSIRHLIRHVKQKKQNQDAFFEQQIIRLAELELKKMLNEGGVPDVDPTPNKSTGINVLEELLKKIVPVLKTDYKSLTTNEQQRASFRAHIVNAVVRTLTPAIANDAAGGPPDAEEPIEEEIDIDIVDDVDDKFIDIRTDSEKKAEDEENKPDEKEEFGQGVDGDETGRNMAYQSFKKVETAILDAYELLSDTEDQELFYDYLIANLKLYFNKFEDELSASVEEPSNQAYDDAVAAGDAATDAAVEAPPEGELAPEEDEEEFDLDIEL